MSQAEQTSQEVKGTTAETTVTAQLREKIKSKMDVAKFFAGFISLLIGILLKEGVALGSLWSRGGIALLAASLGFCVAAVFAYDRLLMPRKYWSALGTDNLPDDRFDDHLQANMIRSWTALFVPAVGCFGVGFVLLLAKALNLTVCAPETPYLIALLVAAVAAPIWLGLASRPRIYRDAGRTRDAA